VAAAVIPYAVLLVAEDRTAIRFTETRFVDDEEPVFAAAPAPSTFECPDT
jgi:hypothetical protein